MACQPCGKSAQFWCVVCKEPLCEPCTNYHKALKATKDHKTVKSKDYGIISDFLSMLQIKCKTHPEKDVEYYCSVHETVFCVICTRNEHVDCSDVRNIEEQDSIEHLYSNLESFSEQSRQQLLALDSITENKRKNIDQLKTQQEAFLQDLKEKRLHINSTLDEFEAQIKTKFETRFQCERTKIEDERNKYLLTQTEWQKEYKLLTQIIKLKPLSCIQLYIAKDKVQKQTEEKQEHIKRVLDELNERTCVSEICVDISPSNRFIKLNDKINVRFSKSNLKEKEKSIFANKGLVLESSTSEADNLSFQNEASKASDRAIANKILDGQHMTQNPAENTRMSDSGEKLCMASKMYRFIHSFQITTSKKISTNSVSCIKHLLNGNIVVGVISEPKLVIYNKSGKRLGFINLTFSPSSIAVVDDINVAVTSNKALVIVNIEKLYMDYFAPQYDFCYGMARIGQNLIVNGEYNGLLWLDLFGNQQDVLPFVKGFLFMTMIKPNKLVYIRRDSKTVHLWNIFTDFREKYFCPDVSEVSGITADDRKNIYVSCKATNKIFMLKYGCSAWEVILSSSDKIDQPQCIDFYKDSLLVVNKNNSVHIYERKV